MPASTRRSSLPFPALLAIVALAGSCVDAPYAPEDAFVSGPLVLAPKLSLVGPGGAPAATAGQADALSEAFDRVDRFRMVVRRLPDNSIVVDTLIRVTPGQDEYDLSVSVTPTSADERYLVTLTALEGETELFTAPPIAVRATPVNSNAARPAPVNITLTYSGPGATATSVEVDPAVVVLGPEGTATLTAIVRDEDGTVLSDVPLSWTVGSAPVATVADGVVTGQLDGITTVVVATPTGLEATMQVYVVSGTLAYVQGGQVKVRAAAGDGPEDRTADVGASAPTWSADGGRLYFAAGGSVRLAGADAAIVIVEGGWPAVSPNGAYLAVDRGGQVVFANVDGSMERTGPSGTTPVWANDGTLIVGGGSIERVDVSGAGRSMIVSGDAQHPALGPGGAVAYLSGSELMVAGRATSLAGGASGRPSWSTGGMWLAFGSAEGIMVVPADGSGPAVALPGLTTATDAAWQPSSPMASPSAPFLSGLDPHPPIPGQAVDILGGGFDRVIPANNRVFWPTPDGSEESAVSAVASGALSTVMPRRLAAGQIRVENRAGTATLGFIPSLAALAVLAHTPWDTGVPRVLIVVLNAAGVEVARGETDLSGMFLVPGLVPGRYTVHIAPPNNFAFPQSRTQVVSIGTEMLVMDLVMTPLVATVQVDPEAPIMAVGERISVGLTAYDAEGNVMPEFESIRWGPVTSHMGVGGSGFSGTLVGTWPTAEQGAAQYFVALDGQVFVLGATVTSRIEGEITRTTEEGTEPVRSHAVMLEKDGSVIARAETDGAGRYFFEGLMGGEYVVRPADPDAGSVNPESRTVTLDNDTPEGKADFVAGTGSGLTGPGEVIVVGDMNYWGPTTGYFWSADNRQFTVNLVTNGASTRVVWYRGHNSIMAKSTYGTLINYHTAPYDYITGTMGYTVDVQEGTTTGGLSIPDDAGSFWIWMPRDALDAADVAEILRYVATGGRVVVVGELGPGSSLWGPANARIQEMMTALGSGAVYNGACLSGTTTNVAGDPLMTSVASVRPTCTSHFTPGTGDRVLASLSGSPIIIRLGVGSPAPSPAKSVLMPSTSGAAAGDSAEGTDRDGVRTTPARVRRR